MPVVTLALVCLLPVKLEASTTQHQVCFAYLRLTASDEAATVQGTMPMLTTANLRACFRQSLEGSAAMTARQRSSTVGIGRQAGKQASKQASKSKFERIVSSRVLLPLSPFVFTYINSRFLFGTASRNSGVWSAATKSIQAPTRQSRES
ncbi:uncharacterized protein UHOD_11556 [Ustilago sp. UG-2017b]|nr:uncharacterized protein UHOD_11556 [Ustilago sp. UG-2017b]